MYLNHVYTTSQNIQKPFVGQRNRWPRPLRRWLMCEDSEPEPEGLDFWTRRGSVFFFLARRVGQNLRVFSSFGWCFGWCFGWWFLRVFDPNRYLFLEDFDHLYGGLLSIFFDGGVCAIQELLCGGSFQWRFENVSSQEEVWMPKFLFNSIKTLQDNAVHTYRYNK